jgi:hypothetical protein
MEIEGSLRGHKSPPLDAILKPTEPDSHSHTLFILNSCFNIIFPSMSRSPKRSLSFTFSS